MKGAIVSQRIRAKHVWKRTKLVWVAFSGFVVNAAAVAAALYVGLLFIEKLTYSGIEIAPIGVPEGLNKQGYTPSIVAERLRDAVEQLILEAKSTKTVEDIALKSELPDVSVPSVGLSLDTIVSSISSHFHIAKRQDVSGEIVQKRGQLSLTLRINRTVVPEIDTADDQHPDSLFIVAARSVLHKAAPLFLGNVFFNEGKYSRAIVEYQEAIKIDTRDEYPHDDLADILYHEGKFHEAIAEYGKAIKIDGNDAYAYTGLATVLHADGQCAAAVNEINKAIRINPRNEATVNNMGNLFKEEGMYTEAAMEYEKAAAIDPSAANPHNNLGNVFALEVKHSSAIVEYAPAIMEFATAIKLDPHFAYPHNGLGNIWYAVRNYDRAILEYNEAIRIDSHFALAHNGLGNAYIQKRKYRRALLEFDEAIRVDQQFSKPARLRSVCGRRIGILQRLLDQKQL